MCVEPSGFFFLDEEIPPRSMRLREKLGILTITSGPTVDGPSSVSSLVCVCY